MKKYKLTSEQKQIGSLTLFRIEALCSFGIVTKGERGGFIEKEDNLSQEGDAWVSGDALVYGDAQVSIRADIKGKAKIDFEIPRLGFDSTEGMKAYIKAVEKWVEK